MAAPPPGVAAAAGRPAASPAPTLPPGAVVPLPPMLPAGRKGHGTMDLEAPPKKRRFGPQKGRQSAVLVELEKGTAEKARKDELATLQVIISDLEDENKALKAELKALKATLKVKFIVNKRGKMVSRRASRSASRAYLNSQFKSWSSCVSEARKRLGLIGFVAIGGRSAQGQALHATAKALHTAKPLPQPSLSAIYKATVPSATLPGGRRRRHAAGSPAEAVRGPGVSVVEPSASTTTEVLGELPGVSEAQAHAERMQEKRRGDQGPLDGAAAPTGGVAAASVVGSGGTSDAGASRPEQAKHETQINERAAELSQAQFMK